MTDSWHIYILCDTLYVVLILVVVVVLYYLVVVVHCVYNIAYNIWTMSPPLNHLGTIYLTNVTPGTNRHLYFPKNSTSTYGTPHGENGWIPFIRLRFSNILRVGYMYDMYVRKQNWYLLSSAYTIVRWNVIQRERERERESERERGGINTMWSGKGCGGNFTNIWDRSHFRMLSDTNNKINHTYYIDAQLLLTSIPPPPQEYNMTIVPSGNSYACNRWYAQRYVD